jgi:hypothetical protein
MVGTGYVSDLVEMPKVDSYLPVSLVVWEQPNALETAYQSIKHFGYV